MPGILEDPLTGDFPSRNELEEEEEAAVAANLPEQYTVEPTINLEEDSRASTLVVLVGSAAELSADAAFHLLKPVGTISVPELQRLRSPLEEELGHPHHTHQFTAYKPQSEHEIDNSTLLLISRRPLPAEQAVTWVKTVIPAIAPSWVVVAFSILSMEYRGPGDAAEENLVFYLSNTVAATKGSAENSPPVLPAGNLVTGLPAALLQECDAAGIPATAIVAVESSPVPDVGLVCSLGDAVCAVAGRSAIDPGMKKQIGQQVDAMYISSASNSMFI